MDDELSFADAFAGGLEQAFRSKRWLKDKDCIAAEGFCFNEFPGGIAADLFVRGPEKDKPMTQGNFCLLQSIESKESLREAGLHIEDAWAIRFSTGDAEGHFVQSAAGIDSVVVAEDEELARRTRFFGPPGHTKLVAANFLYDSFDACAAFVPFLSENVAA